MLAAAVEAALAAGHKVFGENRVQEAASMFPALRGGGSRPCACTSSARCRPTRRARRWPSSTSSRPSTARSPAARSPRRSQQQGRTPALYVQVNTGEEPQKAGVAPGGPTPSSRPAATFGLRLTGLMCIPPADEHPAPHFALLAKIAARNGLRSSPWA